ncbi:MAG: hypothetical protein WBL93_14740 [Lutisporaceae bacterium]
MAVIQTSFEISEEAVAGLLSGDLIRHGGVVYLATGGIFEHLKDISLPEVSKAKGVNYKYLAIGLGVVVVVTAVAVGTIQFIKSKRNKESVIPEIPKCIDDYNFSLCKYLEAVRNGNLDLDIINRLIADLDFIRKNYDSNKIIIEFSVEQLQTLLNLIFDYTKNLAEANTFEFGEKKELEFVSADSTIIYLRRYMEIQKQIFESVA